VSHAQKCAQAMGWSSFFVGLTVLALGTSLPELATSIWASVTQNTTLVAANVVGSNIANILVILGVSAVFAKTITLDEEGLRQQLSLFFISSILLIVTLYDGSFVWQEGILLLSAFLSYSVYSYKEHKAGRLEALKNWALSREVTGKLIASLSASALILGASSYMAIHALEELSSSLNIVSSVLGVSLLALGTSLPELATAWVAIKAKKNSMAVGTLVGSNIVNASIVMALPSFLNPLDVSNSIHIVGIPFLIIATLLLMLAVAQKRIHAYEGGLYVILYLLFLQQLFTSF
jgi:cation:H+ antiporter